jgi:hypothetical protein
MIQKLKLEQLAPYIIPSVLIGGISLALLELMDYWQFLLPVVGFACGYFLRPRKTWVIWIVSVAIFAGVLGILILSGYTPPKVPTDDRWYETIGGFVANMGFFAVYLGLVAALPLWIGRRIAEWSDRSRALKVPLA